MISRTRASAALATLAVILAITASWWALALWPVGPSVPAWFLRTRAICFGATPSGLPNAGGWLLLIGQPLGMLAVLGIVWTAEVRAGLALAMSRVAGQIALGIVTAALVAGIGGVAVRVARAGDRPFSAGADREIAAQLTRVNDAAPALSLVDQHGRTVTLDEFRGRPILVTFAYAHCETVCPAVVADVLAAGRRLTDSRPAILIVTLDPWRDTPSRLGAIATTWRVDGGARVLSGPPNTVERTLNAWRVPRVRNEKTGDFSHPSVVYVVGPDGRITYVVAGGAETIAAAVRAL
jgi:cytochrome oxidase Cu insertion factor (SCO1/SenC/PrrC family)